MKRKRPKYRPCVDAMEQRALLSTTGLNLGANVDFPAGSSSGGDVFVDLRNEFNPWGQVNSLTVPDKTIPLTPDGYPLADAGTYQIDDGDVLGDYQLSFTGTGTVTFSGAATLEAAPVKGADGVSHALVDLNNAGGDYLGLRITNIDPNDPVRNLHLIAPGYSPTTTQVYTNDYLKILQPFSTLRMMDWMKTNYNTDGVWADRTLPTSFSQNNSQGISWEDQIELANEANKDIWINIPDQATPAYVQQLAQLVHADLKPNLNVYVEYSNETWNTGTPQYDRVLAVAATDPRVTWTSSDQGKVSQESALQIKADGDIFRQAFGADSAQVRPVFAGIAAYSTYMAEGLALLNTDYGDPSQYLYAAAVAPYVGVVPGTGGSMKNLDQVFAGMTKYLTKYDTPWIKSSEAVAAKYQLPMVAYEGGQTLTSSSGLSGALVVSAQSDPRMGQIYTQLMTIWTQNGGSLFDHYSLVQPSGFWGGWGLLPSVTAAGSVRWDTLMSLTHTQGDATLDNQVNFDDFTALKANFGATTAWRSQGDFNQDRVVNGADLSLLRANLDNTVTPAQAVTIALFNSPTTDVLGTPTTFNGGGQSKNGLTYHWSVTANGQTLTSVTTPGFIDTPTIAGTVVVTVTATNAAGVSATGSVSMNVNPAVLNPGFETPVLTAHQYVVAPTNATWTFQGTAGISTNGSALASGNSATPAGAQVGYIEQTGSISQTINNWVDQPYQISLRAAQRSNYQASRQNFEILIDSQVVGIFTPASTAYQTLTSAPFLVTAGTHTLTIQGLDSAGGDNTVFLDSISASLASSPVSAADPGFEAVALGQGSYAYDPSGSPWNFVGQSGISSNGSAFTAGSLSAPDGSNVAFVEGKGSFSQTIANWPGGIEQIAFQMAQRANNGLNHEDVQILIDGQVVGTATPSGTNYQAYATQPFNLSAGSHTLTIQGIDSQGGDNTLFLDGISLIGANVPLGDASWDAVQVAAKSYVYTPTGSSWTFTTGAGIASNGSAFTSGNDSAPSGTQVAFIQSKGTMSQTVVGWAAGAYQLHFLAAQRAYHGVNRENFQVLVDGIVVGTFTPTGSSYQSYSTSTFNVAAGSHVISFQGLDTVGGDNTVLLDNLTATAVQAQPTPLQDAGFELPAQAAKGFTMRATGTAWVFAGSSGVASNGSAYTSSNPSAPAGTQVGVLQKTGSISQTLSWMDAGTYQITFQAAQRANYQASHQDFAVLVDNQVVATITPTGTTYKSYATSRFSLAGGSHTITFRGLDSAGGDNTVFLDSIVIQAS